MAKSRQRNVAKQGTGTSSDPPKPKDNVPSPTPSPPASILTSDHPLWKWLYHERQGLLWVLGCSLLGALLGFGIGTGHLTGSIGAPVAAWRIALAGGIRASQPYLFFKRMRFPSWSSDESNTDENLNLNPAHPWLFEVLREAIVRETGGFVHQDLQFMVPAPCGAARGVGMMATNFNDCQTRCYPGIADEKREFKGVKTPHYVGYDDPPIYKQEEILIRLPLTYQMTRQGALKTLKPLFPAEVLTKTPLEDLDDAALLVMYLAHERGMSRASKWLPYIASLPAQPSCGYSKEMRPQLLDSLAVLEDQVGLNVQGWPTELAKACKYAESIAAALAKSYGIHLKRPPDITVVENLEWALCHVASRATAGSEKHGALRLLPLLDLLNHDTTAGAMVEITGNERLDEGDPFDATELDSGFFVVRALRHGRRRALKRGQELLVNYNIPHYTPLDWFMSLGFVPPERWSPFLKIDPVLPRVRRNGPFNPVEEFNNNEWIKVSK